MADLNLNNIMIGSAQPEALGEFYARVLDRAPDMKEGGFYGWRAGSAWVSVGEHSEGTGQAKEPQRGIMNFETKDGKSEFERVRSTGGTVVKDPDEPGGSGVGS